MFGKESDFVVRLIDRVTGPARKIARSIKQVGEAAIVSTVGLKAFKRALAGLDTKSVSVALAKGYLQLGQSFSSLKYELEFGFTQSLRRAAGVGAMRTGVEGFLKITDTITHATQAVDAFRRATKRVGVILRVMRKQASRWQIVGIAASIGFNQVMSASVRGLMDLVSWLYRVGKAGFAFAMRVAVRSVLNFTHALVTGAARWAVAVSAFGGTAAALAITFKTLKMGDFAERATLAFSAMEGRNALRGARAFEVAVALSRQLGTGVEETVDQMVALRRAQFTIGESKEWVSLMADMQATGSTAEQVSSAIRAVTQVKGKGRLLAEELTGQLAETGVSIELVKQKLAELTGKDMAGVQKMLDTGGIGGDLGLEAVRRAIMMQSNVANAGDAATQLSLTTLGGLWRTLEDIPNRFFLDVAQKMGESNVALDAVRKVILAIEGMDRDAFARFVENMIVGLSNLAGMGTAFFQGFFEELDKLTWAMKWDENSVLSLEKAKINGKEWARIMVDGIAVVKAGFGILDKFLKRFEEYGGLPQLHKDAREFWGTCKQVWGVVTWIKDAMGGWANVLITIMTLRMLTPFLSLAVTIAFTVWKVKQLAKALTQISKMTFPGVERMAMAGGMPGMFGKGFKGGQKVVGKAGEALGKAPGQVGKILGKGVVLAAKGAVHSAGQAAMGVPGMKQTARGLGKAKDVTKAAASGAGKIAMGVPGMKKVAPILAKAGPLARLGGGKIAGMLGGALAAGGLAVGGVAIAPIAAALMATWTAYEVAQALGLVEMADKAWSDLIAPKATPSKAATGGSSTKNNNIKIDMPITINRGDGGTAEQDAAVWRHEVSSYFNSFADERLDAAVP